MTRRAYYLISVIEGSTTQKVLEKQGRIGEIKGRHKFGAATLVTVCNTVKGPVIRVQEADPCLAGRNPSKEAARIIKINQVGKLEVPPLPSKPHKSKKKQKKK